VVTNLVYICKADRGLYGAAFFTFLCCTVPVEQLLLFWAYASVLQRDAFQRTALYTFASCLAVGIFGLHRMLAAYAKLIHRPVKVLYGFIARSYPVVLLEPEVQEVLPDLPPPLPRPFLLEESERDRKLRLRKDRLWQHQLQYYHQQSQQEPQRARL